MELFDQLDFQQSWLAKQGIMLRLTAPYSLQQNSIAKRCNCTSADLIRAMLIEQCLPKVLWGTAVLHAAYLHNQAYTTTLPSVTPYECWTHKKPNVSSLQEFGLPVSVLHEGPSDKLNPKGNIHIFVGCEDGPKAICYYDIQTKQVKITQNYHFLPCCEHPPQFEGEVLGENKLLWELSGGAQDVEERRDTPLTTYMHSKTSNCECRR